MAKVSIENPFGDPVEHFMRNAAKEILSELKESLGGRPKRAKRGRKKREKQRGATVVEVMASGLQERMEYDALDKVMRDFCKSKILHDLAEYEILETKVVNQWLVVFHFSFLSPLPPEAAQYETEVALNQEADDFGLLGYKVTVHG